MTNVQIIIMRLQLSDSLASLIITSTYDSRHDDDDDDNDNDAILTCTLKLVVVMTA